MNYVSATKIVSNKRYVYVSTFRDHFYQFGEIRSVTMVSRQQCAFVQFTTRSSAEAAAEKSFNKLILQVGKYFLVFKGYRSQYLPRSEFNINVYIS